MVHVVTEEFIIETSEKTLDIFVVDLNKIACSQVQQDIKALP